MDQIETLPRFPRRAEIDCARRQRSPRCQKARPMFRVRLIAVGSASAGLDSRQTRHIATLRHHRENAGQAGAGDAPLDLGVEARFTGPILPEVVGGLCSLVVVYARRFRNFAFTERNRIGGAR